LTGGSKATLSPRVKGGQPTDAYIIIDEIEAIKEVLLEKQKEFTFYTAKLERKISCLKHLQHKIMWLRYVEGLSFANISEQMNLELRYCRRLYQCAMKILEKNL
ncbi:MAG: sigma factor-like helix-turn-helix DNA-binding protein, partial [Clostridia bacterium]